MALLPSQPYSLFFSSPQDASVMGLLYPVKKTFSARPEWKGVFIPIQKAVESSDALIWDAMTHLYGVLHGTRTPREALGRLKACIFRLVETCCREQKRPRCIILTDWFEHVPARKSRTQKKRDKSRKKKRAFATLSAEDAKHFQLTDNGLLNTRSGIESMVAPSDLLEARLLRSVLFEYLEQGLGKDAEVFKRLDLTFVQRDTRAIPEVASSSKLGEAELRATFCAEALMAQGKSVAIATDAITPSAWDEMEARHARSRI